MMVVYISKKGKISHIRTKYFGWFLLKGVLYKGKPGHQILEWKQTCKWYAKGLRDRRAKEDTLIFHRTRKIEMTDTYPNGGSHAESMKDMTR